MSYQKLSRNQIAERVAQDIPDGAYVNLGIGLPTKIASYLPSDKDVFLHSENGLLAFGPPPEKGQEDPELINAGKEYDVEQHREPRPGARWPGAAGAVAARHAGRDDEPPRAV